MPHSLLLVPTGLERRVIEPVVTAAAAVAIRIELCGFGPVVAAARTAALIAAARPERVLLVGIAGRLDERLAIGSAHGFSHVTCDGIGVGSGDGHTPAERLGWSQWPGSSGDPTTRIGDTLPCSSGRLPADAQAGLLLTVCSAAADPADTQTRRRRHPDALAEEMEGFGVAAACRLAGVPLDIVRGISNTAGDREKASWRVDDACRAAATLAATLLGGRP